MQKILVTGAAGFIGHNLSKRLLENGRTVVGLDNLNDYYDPELKKARLAQLLEFEQFNHAYLDMADRGTMEKLFAEEKFDAVVNLAAQAGVRYSLINPHSYADTNIIGFLNILEGCRHNQVKHLLYASSSS
ncbi:MAG: NAD-dependent epimerase/dehydratase family protein, partial [Candidatus Electrothrix sp. AUS4]|nr:NAD-dependent epimerase/dehydratase family protein [Candidatus Electrothrix sp. AUS4]